MAPSRVWIYVQPGARRSELVGFHGDDIKVRIAAPPEDGRANKELLALLSGLLGINASELSLCVGHSSRRKLIELPNQLLLERLQIMARQI